MSATTLVGLDIGALAVRAAETRRGKDGASVVKWAQAPLPAGTVRAGAICDPDTVTATLRRLWSTGRLGSRKVVLGLTNPQVVVREMSVPNLTGHKLRQALPFQVRDVLPLPVERSILDFCPLADPGTGDTVRGLLIAAPKDPVLAAVHAVQRAGLHVTRVDLAAFALLRAAARRDGQVEAIVDIGAQGTTVIVHADGTPLIVRTIPSGGTDVTEAVARRLGVPVAAAEQLKCAVGLSGGSDPATATAVQDAVRPLVTEVRSSFTYLTAGARRSRVTRVVLSGGGSLLGGLAGELATQLDVTVVPADPVARLHEAGTARYAGPGPLPATAAVSIGLTLGAA
jgi:type IV pilus assembly protein PilM